VLAIKEKPNAKGLEEDLVSGHENFGQSGGRQQSKCGNGLVQL
jgi:hypothetical protein